MGLAMHMAQDSESWGEKEGEQEGEEARREGGRGGGAGGHKHAGKVTYIRVSDMHGRHSSAGPNADLQAVLLHFCPPNLHKLRSSVTLTWHQTWGGVIPI